MAYSSKTGLKIKDVLSTTSADWGNGYPHSTTISQIRSYAEEYRDGDCIDTYLLKEAEKVSYLEYNFDTSVLPNDIESITRLKLTFKLKMYNPNGFFEGEHLVLQMYNGDTQIGESAMPEYNNTQQIITIDNIPIPANIADLANYKIKLTAKRSATNITSSSSLEQYGCTLLVYHQTTANHQYIAKQEAIEERGVIKGYSMPFPDTPFLSVTGVPLDTFDASSDVLDEDFMKFELQNKSEIKGVVDLELDFSRVEIPSWAIKVGLIYLRLNRQLINRNSISKILGEFVLGTETISFPFDLKIAYDTPQAITIEKNVLKREIPASRLNELKLRLTLVTPQYGGSNNPAIGIYGLTVQVDFSDEALDNSLYEYFLASKFVPEAGVEGFTITTGYHHIENTYGLTSSGSNDTNYFQIRVPSGAGKTGKGFMHFDFTNVPTNAKSITSIISKIRLSHQGYSSIEFVRFQWYYDKFPVSELVVINPNASSATTIELPIKYLPRLDQLDKLTLRIVCKRKDTSTTTISLQIYTLETKIIFASSGAEGAGFPIEIGGGLNLVGNKTVKAFYVGNQPIITMYIGNTELSKTEWIGDEPPPLTGDEPEEVPEGSGLPCTYEVVNEPNKDTYGFTLNANGYWESTNQGVDSSYSMCRVNFYANGRDKLYFDCINYGESSYDYGAIGLIDGNFDHNANVSASQTHTSLSDSQSADVQRVSLGRPTEGNHFIYIKYVKDSSVNKNNDSLQFKVVFLTPEEEGLV